MERGAQEMSLSLERRTNTCKLNSPMRFLLQELLLKEGLNLFSVAKYVAALLNVFHLIFSNFMRN